MDKVTLATFYVFQDCFPYQIKRSPANKQKHTFFQEDTNIKPPTTKKTQQNKTIKQQPKKPTKIKKQTT